MGPSRFDDRLDAAAETYARYAFIYDALFDDIRDDVAFYLGRAGAPDARAHILELGAGTGRVTERLLEAGHRVTAVDRSPEMLAKAGPRVARFGARARLVEADVARLALGERFTHVFAPYGMVAHFVGDDERRDAYRAAFEHLAPGGAFVFDDRPAWLMDHPDDGAELVHLRTRRDPATGHDVRLSTTCVDLDAPPVTLRHDFIDWLADGRVVRRVVVRIVLRNVPLDAELALLHDVGFRDVALLGSFRGAPFDRDRVTANERLIVTCRRPE